MRDKDSGLVLESRDLTLNQDYDFDPIQGRLLLSRALSSTNPNGQLVQTSSSSGNPVYLVVRYEYQPVFSDPADLALGFRGTGWLGDHLRLGQPGGNSAAK